ncbi:MAG TPA: methionine--tRNA ligase [Patescibacteria group bacterium]|nr:methionine--tRNA ligase [Patescibacteria group bacterium]
MKLTVTYDDFSKLDIRVGTVVSAEIPEWSGKLLQFQVDFGSEIGIKTIFSGVKKWYQPGDFVTKQFLFIVNLQEKKMGDSASQGMMLMAIKDDKPILVQPMEAVANGTAID